MTNQANAATTAAQPAAPSSAELLESVDRLRDEYRRLRLLLQRSGGNARLVDAITESASHVDAACATASEAAAVAMGW